MNIVITDISIEHTDSPLKPTNELILEIGIDNMEAINDIDMIFYADSPNDPISATINKHANGITATLKTHPVSEDIKYRITKINGYPTTIESNMNISSFYITDEREKPYDLLEHAYNFSNLFCDSRELRKIAMEAGVENMPLSSALETCRWIGKCFGMAASSNIYLKDSNAKPEGLENTETYGMSIDNKDVVDNISRYHTSQWFLYSQPWKRVIKNFGTSDMKELLGNIKNSLKSNIPVILAIITDDEMSGHAVSVYKLVEINDKEVQLYLYDNNSPSQLRSATIDLINNKFEYRNFGVYTKAEAITASKIISPSDIQKGFVRFIDQTFEELRENHLDALALGSPARMLVVDAQGRRMGFVVGIEKVNEIPNGEIVEFEDTEGHQSYIYYVPSDLDYEVRYFGIDKGNLEIEMITPELAADQSVIRHSNIPVEPGTIAILKVEEETEFSLEVDTNNDGNIDKTYILDRSSITAIEDQISELIPNKFYLVQNYPNPFNSMTTIRFDLPISSQTDVSIYDIHGQIVITLIKGKLEAGHYSFLWNGTNNDGKLVATSVYLYRLKTDNYHETKKMVYIK